VVAARSLTFTFEVAGETQIRRRTDGLMERVEDFSPAFERIAEHFRAHLVQVFESEGGATRRGRWADLSPGYARWKAKHYPGRSVLIREDKLRKAMTQEGAPGNVEEIGPTTLVMGGFRRTANGRWDVATTHQKGRRDGSLPARPIIDLPEQVKGRWMQILRDHVRTEA